MCGEVVGGVGVGGFGAGMEGDIGGGLEPLVALDAT